MKITILVLLAIAQMFIASVFASDQEKIMQISRLVEDRQYKTALSELKQIKDSKLFQAHPDLYPRLRGTIYLEMRDYNTAMLNFDKALSLNPKNADTFYSIGVCHHKQGQISSAIFSIKKAIELSNNEKSKSIFTNGLTTLKQECDVIPLCSFRVTYSPPKPNKYLFVPPIDDSALVGRVLEWEGLYDMKLNEHHIAYFPGIGHEEYRWTFVNPRNIDLTRIKKDWVRVIGEYSGRAKFSTLAGGLTEIPVLKILYIENTKPTHYGTALVFREGVK